MKKYVYKFVIISSFILFTGFGGCNLFNWVFLALGFVTPPYNAHMGQHFPGSYHWYVANSGAIYSHNGDFQTPFELEYTVPGNPDLFDIRFGQIPGQLYFLVVGENGALVKSTYSSFSVKNSTVNVDLNLVLANDRWTSKPFCFAIGNEGTVIKSTDHGETWGQISFPTTDDLHSIGRNTEGVIFVGGENYSLYKTTNFGEDWISTGPGDLAFRGPLNSYKGIYFYNDTIGYVGGPYGLIIKTTDAGNTWETQIANGFSEVNDFHFISPDSGVAVGTNGIARFTTDGGDSWFEDDSVTSFLDGATIKRISAMGKYYGLIIGDGDFDMFVAKDSTYLDSMKTVTDVAYNPQLVEDYQLYQNYPNPFNPSTKIKFQIPETGLVTLKVYDILGSEITTLVDEELSAGQYEYDFHGDGLYSGIYFAVLKTNRISETIKMILLK